MIKMTLSLRAFLVNKYPELVVPISFGHIEEFTSEIQNEYLEWCKTEEGGSYLEGGSNYK